MTGLVSLNPLDAMRQHRADGSEFWSARELQAALGYSKWERFADALERASVSCQAMGHNPLDHFPGAGKMIETGKGATREVEDYHLSRYACYLTAMNGDPRKPEIAAAQAYFVQQTRKAELFEAAQQSTPALISVRGVAAALGCSNKSALNRLSHRTLKPTHHFFEPLCQAPAYLFPLDEVRAIWPSVSFQAFQGEAIPGVAPVARAVTAIRNGKVARKHHPRLIPTDNSVEQLARRLLSLEAQKKVVLKELAALGGL